MDSQAGIHDITFFETSRLWSLLGMLRFYALHVYTVAKDMDFLERSLDPEETWRTQLSQGVSFDPKALKKMLEEARDHMDELELPVSKATIERVIELTADVATGVIYKKPLFRDMFREKPLYDEEKRTKLYQNAIGFKTAFKTELKSLLAFAIPQKLAKYYAPEEPLFGLGVDKKFPSVTYEIEQAGKCYACDFSSASAFHSIRTMEAGIRAMSRCLGIPDPTKGKDRTWSNVSDSLRRKIETTWPASTGRMSGDAYIFDKLYGAIAAMQNPYRNETMHLDAKYTAPEALHIFELVKGLMQKIASRMDEDGEPKV